MPPFNALFLALTLATGAVAAPGAVGVGVGAGALLRDEPQLVPRQGFALQRWANENANMNFTNGPAGEYQVTWDNPSGGNFVVGKGYPGGDLAFNYSGTFEVDGNAYLGLYGWTTDPLTEYYVIESFGSHNPNDNSNATCYGTFESDGGTYEVWMKWRVNAPSIIGEATFPQFWSVRTLRHVGGTISTGRHFEAWTNAGLELGDQTHMHIAIEGQQGDGAADITAGVVPTTSVAETATPTTRTQRPMDTNTCIGDL